MTWAITFERCNLSVGHGRCLYRLGQICAVAGFLDHKGFRVVVDLRGKDILGVPLFDRFTAKSEA